MTDRYGSCTIRAEKKENMMKTKAIYIFAAFSLLLGACSAPASDETAGKEDEPEVTESAEPAESTSPQADTGASVSTDDYTLKEVVVLSRHNIRSPLTGGGSVLDTSTDHEWFSWTSNASELSLRGGAAETMMGQYFRKWLEAEGLMTDNEMPSEEAVRFYANAKQRTIATANYFSSGFLPVADVNVEYHAEYDTMDPVFNPVLTFMSDSYAKAAEAAIHEYDDAIDALAPSYELLKDVIDYEQSTGCKAGSCPVFSTKDSVFTLEQGKEPSVKGTLKTACSLADALVLQYYEEPDKVKAGFGKDLSIEDWESISKIKDVYSEALFCSRPIAVNAANPLLKEIQSELNQEGRKFTFLCGHDSNVLTVLAALDTEHYELPQAIEKQTPIGCKLLFEKWLNKENEEFVRIRLVYESPDQLRDLSMVTLDSPPCSYDLSLTDMERNEDGLYRFEDVMDRFSETIAAYDQLAEDYAD